MDMTFLGLYWKPVDDRYYDDKNRKLHLMLENLYAQYDEARTKLYSDVTDADRENDKKIINVMTRLHADCDKYDLYERSRKIKNDSHESILIETDEYRKYRASKDVRNNVDSELRHQFWLIMQLMDVRGWKNTSSMDEQMAWLVLYYYYPQREHGDYGRKYDGSEIDSIRKLCDNARALTDISCDSRITNDIERERIIMAAGVFDRLYNDSMANI